MFGISSQSAFMSQLKETAPMERKHLVVWSEELEPPNVFAEEDLNQYRIDFSIEALRPHYDYWSVSIHDSLTGLESNWYSAAEWSKQLVYGSQGNLTLRLHHAPPESGAENWIQTPKGAFIAIVRLYDLPAGEMGTVSLYKFASSVRNIASSSQNRPESARWREGSLAAWH